ncbi:MAG: site-specific DNA-methyltransferase [Acidobacteria bacterium]|nr:site-specific DNA-methyltransferase [Acidobacteriota bacterium]
MDAETARALDEQAGQRRSGGFPARRQAPKFNVVYGRFNGQDDVPAGRGRTTGGASRFFYCPKANRRERDFGLRPESKAAGSHARELINDHETVKPVELMRWLVRLTTPPDALVLDPFAGSGSTGVACLLEERSFRGIEQDPKYAAIARVRIDAASSVEPRPPRSACPTRKESGSTRCRATTHPIDPS